jgi:hypothetical protein
MGKGDEAKAAALIRIGEIQARAAEQQGQAWGNAIQGLGNIASKTITDYNSPEARRQREVDKGNAILKAKALEQKQYEAQRVARGNLVPGRDELQFIPATTGSNPFDAPFRNVNFGGGSRVTTDETFALAQAGPNGEIIENALPNEGLRNSLSRLNAFGPTDGVLGAPPQVARPDALSRGMEGALGTTEMRRTLPTGRPDRIETYKKKAVGRYVTAGGLYDVKTAFDDLVEAGISQEVATHLAKQGLEANTIFSMADDLAEKSRKSQVAVAGSIANLALQAHAANPTSSLEDTLRSLQGPSGNRIPQDQLDQFEVAFFGKSPQEQESILQSMVRQWDAQGKGQAFAPGTIVRGEFSGNQEQVGTAPVAEPSAASKTLARAEADYAEGIRKGSIPLGTSFTEWSKKTPQNITNAGEALNAYARGLGYTGDDPRLQLTSAQRNAYTKEQANLTRGPEAGRFVWTKDGLVSISVGGRTTPVLDSQGKQVLPQDTAQVRNYDFSTKRVMPLLEGMAELAQRINVLDGIQAKAVGLEKKAAAKLNYDNDVAEYEALLSTFIPLWARSVGHTGVLTEQDVKSARKMFPNPGDSKDLMARKIKRIEKMLDVSIPGFGNGSADITDPNFGN